MCREECFEEKLRTGEEVRFGKNRKERKTSGEGFFIALAHLTSVYAYHSDLSMRPFLTGVDGEGMVVFHDFRTPTPISKLSQTNGINGLGRNARV